MRDRGGGGGGGGGGGRASHTTRDDLAREVLIFAFTQIMFFSRNPALSRQLLTNFDALFSIANALVAMLCMGASFRFDERAAALLLVSFPYFVLGTALGDATMGDVEFKYRSYAIGAMVLILISGIA